MVQARSPRFFFSFFFIFFCFSLFSLLSHLPGAAAAPRRLHFSFCFSSYFCLLFLFFLFVLIFAFFFLLFSLYFSSDFLFLFFLCPFFLLFFLVFIFDSPFLFLSFFLFYFFALLTPISFLIIQPLADHSFFSLPPPIFTIPSSHFSAAVKRKKISAKESTGERWPHGSERAVGGKTEGRNGMK